MNKITAKPVKRPEKKKLDDRFKWTWEYMLNKKYNQAIADFEKYLPTEEEIIKLIDKCLDDDCMTETSQLAKIILDRINK